MIAPCGREARGQTGGWWMLTKKLLFKGCFHGNIKYEDFGLSLREDPNPEILKKVKHESA